MQLLIIDDDSQLANITAELMACLDDEEHHFERISIARDLETAIRLLPEYDVVLCDGEFPISEKCHFVAERWEVVLHEAARQGSHFVLYSGCRHALSVAERQSVCALSKPSTAEHVYAALMDQSLNDRPSAPDDEHRQLQAV